MKQNLILRLVPVALVLSAAAALGLSSPASSQPSAPASQRCTHAVGHGLATTRLVHVFEHRDGYDAYSEPQYDVDACLRPGGGAVRVSRLSVDGGSVNNNGDGPDESTSDLRIAGTYVSAVYENGLASEVACSIQFPAGTPGASSCDGLIHTAIQVADVRTHRTLSHSVASQPGALAVSSAGIVAWTTSNPAGSVTVLSAIVLRRGPGHTLSGTPVRVDLGRISGKLFFTGHTQRTLHWSKDGRPRERTF